MPPAAFAQEHAPSPMLVAQSADLTTEPASVNRPTPTARPTNPPFSAEQLNSIASSVQRKPKKAEPSIIPIPEALRQEPAAPPAVDPIDFFKVPRPDGGIRVPVGRD